LLVALVMTGAIPGEARQAAARRGQLPPLPLTQLDERALSAELDNRAFTLTFVQSVPVRDLLLLLVRGTSLSVVPDPDINGSFIGELKNVTVRQALNLILPQLGLDYAVDGSFIRVSRRAPETRLFDIHYVATARGGVSDIEVTGDAGSSVRVTGATSTDLFGEIVKSVQTLLSERATYSVDRKAGLLQVTDFPERLERVAMYLDAVHDRAHRQVQIDAHVMEVELSRPDAAALDWDALAQKSGASSVGAPRGQTARLRIADLSRFLTALSAQGSVSTLATPRLLALNNEPAIVRAVSRGPGAREQMVTLGVTPQISSDRAIMLSLSPIVSTQAASSGSQASPSSALRETDMLARVNDGETIVIAGLARDEEIRERRNGGTAGGWFGRSTVLVRKRIELVILLTPRILAPAGAH
jgi:type II secretory pathway component GspD/PulD (secretin)